MKTLRTLTLAAALVGASVLPGRAEDVPPGIMMMGLAMFVENGNCPGVTLNKVKMADFMDLLAKEGKAPSLQSMMRNPVQLRAVADYTKQLERNKHAGSCSIVRSSFGPGGSAIPDLVN